MEFGIFDHLDYNNLRLNQFFEELLQVIELYDRHGFHAWHVAEHHATALGMAPLPNVMLAAVAQRTRRLRLSGMAFSVRSTGHITS